MSLAQELSARGFIHQSSADNLADVLDGEKRTIYHGIDPSADSIHAGNFAVWMLLRHLSHAGHKVIFLVGGGTGMIGDPKPDVERSLTPPEVVKERVEKLATQAKRLLGTKEVTFVNNYDWLAPLQLIDFLRDIGKHFTVNELIKKDAIATRLEGEHGISYTEFAYPLLQAYDYLVLFREHNCTLQVGGSDQWGNIIAGVDLVRKKEQKTVHAITIPLIIDKTTGKKFGKSEGNAVWLDSEKTSPFSFYQFWFNVTDDNVVDYLKVFTMQSLADIETLARELEKNPGVRVAQRTLAKEVTTTVHGKEKAEMMANVSDLLFGSRPLGALTPEEKEILLENAPQTTLTPGTLLVEALVATELATSKREARTFIESGAISLNGEKILDAEATVIETHFVYGVALVRRGKKHVHVLRVDK